MTFAVRFIPDFWDRVDRALSSRGFRQTRANHFESDRLFWLGAMRSRQSLVQMLGKHGTDPEGIEDCRARAELAEQQRDWWAP